MEEQKQEVAVKEESVVEKLKETTEVLKKKVIALTEKNKALVLQLKEKAVAASAKPVEVSKGFIAKAKGLFCASESIVITQYENHMSIFKGVVKPEYALIKIKDARKLESYDIKTGAEGAEIAMPTKYTYVPASHVIHILSK